MNYKSKKNVHQVLTALTVKRLKYYADLCECYSELANIMINEEGRAQVTSADIEQRYSSILSTVAYHDIEDFDIINKMGNFSEKEVALFKRFSEISKNFIDFSNGYNILRHSIDQDSPDVDQEVVSDYLSFMKEKAQNDRTGYFTEYIEAHSPIVIGKNFYSMYTRALQKIQDIDDSHLNIPQFYDGRVLPRSIFGGQSKLHLAGSTRTSSDPVEDLAQDSKGMYTPGDRIRYKRAITPREKVLDAACTTRSRISRKIAQNRLPVRKLAAAVTTALLTGSLLTGCVFGNNGQHTATEAYRSGLELDITDETAQELIQLGQDIDAASNSSDIPSIETLTDLTTRLDSTSTDVAQDLAVTAFEEANPQASDVSASTHFVVDHHDGRQDSITFTYTDETGEVQTFYLDNMDSDFYENFSREYEYVSKFYEDLKALSSDDMSFEERASKTREYVDSLRGNYDDLNEFAGKDASIDTYLFFIKRIKAEPFDRSNETPDSKKDDDISK